MRVKIGPEFRAEWQRFQLRFCCEDCVHFDAEADSCVHGWPNSDHRLVRYLDPDCADVLFCKEFELC